jgi:hypothetical protein
MSPILYSDLTTAIYHQHAVQCTCNMTIRYKLYIIGFWHGIKCCENIDEFTHLRKIPHFVVHNVLKKTSSECKIKLPCVDFIVGLECSSPDRLK